jgi:hypothetical protein
MTSLLLVGEYSDCEVNQNIKRLQRYSESIGLSTNLMNYDQIFNGKNKKIISDDLVIMFFFPFDFWNKNCEIPSDTCVYGTSNESYRIFSSFWVDVKGALERKFDDKKISYIIPPESAPIDRDKIGTHDLLEKNNVSTTKLIPKNLGTIIEVANESGVFIKARYGALGKGITYLSNGGWFTNYHCGQNNRIENYEDGERWKFTEITGNKDFIKRLIDLEVIIEEEIKPPFLNEARKFDVRSYIVFGDTPHMFIRENDSKEIITNFSQGGSINHYPEKELTNESIFLLKEESKKTAKALNTNFLGVDLMFDKDFEHIKVLEAQTFAGWPKIRPCNLPKYLAGKIKDTL